MKTQLHFQLCLSPCTAISKKDVIVNCRYWNGGGSVPYIRMIGMIVVFFRGCNRRFSKLKV